jgi:hypothetical protein
VKTSMACCGTPAAAIFSWASFRPMSLISRS